MSISDELASALSSLFLPNRLEGISHLLRIYRQIGRAALPMLEGLDYDNCALGGFVTAWADGVIDPEGGAQARGWAASLGDLVALLAEWSRMGNPVLRVTAKQAAAWAFSDVARSELQNWRLPWTGLCLELIEPIGLTSHVFVYQESPQTREGVERCYTVAVSRSAASANLWVGARTPEELWQNALGSIECDDGLELGPAAEREMMLALRVLLNAMVEASVPASYKPIEVERVRRRGKRGKPRIVRGPSSSIHQFSREIVIDCRQHVRDYLSSDRNRVLKVRWITRGHWTHQAHGPRKTLRKLLYLEPHSNNRHELPLVEHTYRIADGPVG